jgi:hypothetical protein
MNTDDKPDVDADDIDLDASSTEHLKTEPGSEKVVPTSRIDRGEEGVSKHRPVERFKQSNIDQVAIDVLPTPK